MMNKKIRLFFSFFSLSLLMGAQITQRPVTCGTGIPPQQWEDWFQTQIEKHKAEQATSKQQQASHIIPVIVHVIHFGEAIGAYPNIDSNQIKSQIAVLNADFAGNGLNSHKVPSYFANLKSNTGIQFCLARTDQQDNPLAEKGVHRVHANTIPPGTSPSTPTLDLKSYFYSTIMPATIWDPAKYFNIWTSDKPLNYPLNGFGTYPAGTTLSGLYGNTFGSVNNDGIWIYAAAFGTVGTVTPPYNYGRTATHEVGHWLGLRHIWGDGNCMTDYVNDTPYHKHANYGCDSLPTRKDTCGVNTAPNGEMRMNFMDRTEDFCMYMFTHDQNLRMQTAMSQCQFRNQLGTHGKCTPSPAPATVQAVAGFTAGSKQCLNQPVTLFNTSTGYPYPTYVWNSTPAAPFYPNASVANPAITFPNSGNYTISLVATNSLSSSTYTMLISATQTCAAQSSCLDTLRAIKNVDTLKTYRLPNSSGFPGCQTGFAGYLTGTNCYKDKEIAQFFAPNTFSAIPHTQVNSVIVLFDSAGTKLNNPGTLVTCKLYGGSAAQGPISQMVAKSVPLDSIVNMAKVKSVTYLGKKNQPPVSNGKIYPYKFDFNTPVPINTGSGFFVAIQGPVNSAQDSINVYSNTIYNSAIDSSAWYLNANNGWRTFKTYRQSKIQLAMIPLITCGPAVGIKDYRTLSADNVNVMPNPTSGEFDLVFTLKQEQDLVLRVYSAVGKLVLESDLKHIMNNMIHVDLSEYPGGVYFAEISNGSEKFTRKVVLSK